MYYGTVIFLVCTAFAVSDARLLAAPVPELELTGEALGPLPSPYQAARVRVKLKNFGKPIANELGYYAAFETRSYFTHVKRPGGSAIQELGNVRDGRGGWIGLSNAMAWQLPHNVSQRFGLILGADEALSVTAVLWCRRDEHRIFTEPGEYSFQLTYADPNARTLSKPFTIQVNEAKGDDTAVLRALEQDSNKLAWALAAALWGDS